MTGKKFTDMTREEYDELMCKNFPDLFQDRNKPMSETCMCWGFDIGAGWYKLLYDCCERLDFIREQTGIVAVFDQVKEKFGTGRFYYHIDTKDSKELPEGITRIWCDLISNTVSKAERATETTCATCQEQYFHDQIYMGGWVYDSCDKCIISGKRRSFADDPAKYIEDMRLKKERIRKLKYKIETMNSEDIDQIEVLVSKIEENAKKIKEAAISTKNEKVEEKSV